MELLENEGQNLIESVFLDDIKDEQKISSSLENNQIIFGENLRFWSEEDTSDTPYLEGWKNMCRFLLMTLLR